MCCRVRQFLCGCSLRSGAITATVLTSLSVLGFLIVGLTLVLGHDTIIRIVNEGIDEQARQAERNPDIKVDREKLREFVDTVSSIIVIVGWVFLAFALIALLIVISLGMSICMEKSGLVIPWLVGAMIQIVLSCLGIVSLLFFRFFFALAGLIDVAFMIYMWIIVYNWHMELKGRPMYISPPMKA